MKRSRFALLAALFALGCDRAQASGDVWLEVASPRPQHVESGSVPLVEVRGSAGTLGHGALDVVVVIDVSISTRKSSGADLNGDGHVGGHGWRYRRNLSSWLAHPLTSSDPGDSILRAEVEAIRRLAGRLNPDRTRLGVVAFNDVAVIHSSVGSPTGQLMRALDFIQDFEPTGRTHLEKALLMAATALQPPDAPPGEKRDQLVVLVSDGRPTVPSPALRAAVHAIEAAGELRKRGIRIYTIGLAVPHADSGTLKEIAHVGRGAYAMLDDPATIVDALPNLDLQGLADVEVLNRTTGASARATHVWRDGSFNAFVRLEAGENLLEVTASSPRGTTRTERLVFYEPRVPETQEERNLENARLERMRALVHERRVRIELEKEMEARRAAGDGSERTLSIEVEP